MRMLPNDQFAQLKNEIESLIKKGVEKASIMIPPEKILSLIATVEYWKTNCETINEQLVDSNETIHLLEERIDRLEKRMVDLKRENDFFRRR